MKSLYLIIITLLCVPVSNALVPRSRQSAIWYRQDSGSGISASTNPTLINSTASDPQIRPQGSGGVCGGSPNGCWGSFDINTDSETTFPNTGKVVEYTLEITNTTCSPDGFRKTCLLFNNSIPGPTLILNWGDTARITVINNMQDNGVHWHGIRQLGSNTQDGVNGVTECPLAPGKSRVYTWQATQHGTFWYHSHHSAQYGDGVWGTIIVNGPHSAGYDEDLGTVAMSEVYHSLGSEAWNGIITAEGGQVSIPNNVLFNGTNVNFQGGGKHFQVNVKRGRRYLMRFVNTGVDNFYQVGIDNHILEVVAIDAQAVKPYNTTYIHLGVGQRVDVIVSANQQARSYWMRAIPQSCVSNKNNGTGSLANAILSYTGTSPDMPQALPNTIMTPIADIGCFDEALDRAQPIPPKPVDRGAFDLTHVPLSSPFRVTSVAEGRVFRWVLGSTSMVVNWEQPLLGKIAADSSSGNMTTFTSSDNVIEVDGSSSYAFWYVQNTFGEAHPLHMHGNFMRILGTGNGSWDLNVDALEFDNPMRRDTFMIPSGGYVIMAFETSNPGSWILHCHIAWHVSEGLVTNAVVRRRDIVVPGSELQTMQIQCRDWTEYFENHRKYEFVGSGL